MNIRQERLADAIQRYASEDILSYLELRDHSFGIVSVIGVIVSPDYSYADISVVSQRDEKILPKFLAPLEPSIRRRIGKDFSLRKIPKLRFRIDKKQKNTDNILTLIHTLDTKYGISQ